MAMERGTCDTWRNIRRELNQLYIGYFTSNNVSFSQTPALTPVQERIFKALNVNEPPRQTRITATPVYYAKTV